MCRCQWDRTRRARRTATRGSAHAESVQLVAVEVAEVRDVEIPETDSGAAFILAAELQRFVVQLVHFVARVDDDRDHRAVAARRCFAVVRLDHADTWTVL